MGSACAPRDPSEERRGRPEEPSPPTGRISLCKLRGFDPRLRARLHRIGITRCDQLLEAVGRAGLARLARLLGVPVGHLRTLVQRADLARIRGLGSGFGGLLERLGIRDTAALAAAHAGELHARLAALNGAERWCRRSPTPEEVADWIAQARRLAGSPVAAPHRPSTSRMP